MGIVQRRQVWWEEEWRQGTYRSRDKEERIGEKIEKRRQREERRQGEENSREERREARRGEQERGEEMACSVLTITGS